MLRSCQQISTNWKEPKLGKKHNVVIQTKAEKVLARALQRKNIICKKNYYIQGFEIDLWFPDYKLAVEVDGYTHLSEEQQQRDYHKEQVLLDRGILLIRFNNQQIRENLSQCIQEIESVIARINSVKKDDPINYDWKDTLKNLNIPRTNSTKQSINSIEDYFLNMDKKPP